MVLTSTDSVVWRSKLKTCLCFGFAERRGTSSVYNSAVFIDEEGDICGTYHKTQFAEGTHPSWNFNCIGETIRAFDTPFGRAGILICNDRWNPLIARTLVLDGAQFLLIPSYGSKGKSQNQTVLARARENGVPIVEANVGMNLIINKGEIVAYKWGNDQISTASIDIPVPAFNRGSAPLRTRILASPRDLKWQPATRKPSPVCDVNYTRGPS